MKCVHPEFDLMRDESSPDVLRILWRGEQVGRTRALSDLKRPRSSSCFIVASGPSLASQDLSVLKGRTCIGVNGSVAKSEESGFSFDYHVVADRKFVVDRFDLIEKILRSSADCIFTFRVLNEICARRPELLARDRIFMVSEINSFYGVPRLGPTMFSRWAAHQQDWLVPASHRLHRRATRFPHRVGFSRRLDLGVFTAQTVAFVALQVAYSLGCRHVFLLGVDLGGGAGAGRFYESGANIAPTRLDRDLEPYILPSFAIAGRLRQSEGFSVYNLSPTSRLPEEMIPRMTLEQAVELCERIESEEGHASES